MDWIFGLFLASLVAGLAGLGMQLPMSMLWGYNGSNRVVIAIVTGATVLYALIVVSIFCYVMWISVT
jgi:hypothetical protein